MKNLTREYLKLYENCIYNSNENIVKLSVNAVKNTLMHIGDKLSCDEWITVIEFFDKLFKITTPNKLMNTEILKVCDQIMIENKK